MKRIVCACWTHFGWNEVRWQRYWLGLTAVDGNGTLGLDGAWQNSRAEMDDQDTVYRSFGRAVANCRKRLSMTQLELAKVVGLSRGSIAHIEKGSQKVFLHHAYQLAEALELESIHELLATQRLSKEPMSGSRIRISADGKLSRDLRDQVRSAVGTTIKGNEEE